MSSSKMVNDRQRSALFVSQAAHTHETPIAAALQSALGPLARPGEPVVDWAQVLRLLGRSIDATMKELVIADIAHENEKSDDPEIRRQRDDAVEVLHDELIDLRAGVESVYGAAGLETLGFGGDTPREPIALLRQADSALDNLDAVVALRPVRRGMTLDAAAYRAPLTTARDQLEAARSAVVRESRELEATLTVKNAAMSTHDTQFLARARTLEGLFQVAGHQDLAGRVRPSSRRPGQVEQPPEPEAGATDSPAES